MKRLWILGLTALAACTPPPTVFTPGMAVHGRPCEYTIRRASGAPITLDQWHAAIAAREDVRLTAQPDAITDPQSGEMVIRQPGPGDAEVRFGSGRTGSWMKIFDYQDGTVTFTALVDDSGVTEPEVYLVANALAGALRAEIQPDANARCNWVPAAHGPAPPR